MNKSFNGELTEKSRIKFIYRNFDLNLNLFHVKLCPIMFAMMK